jgi:hypothetical protein
MLLVAVCAVLLGAAVGAQAADMPMGSAPKALEFPHFPSHMHAFVWRNWNLVETERLAQVLDTTPENVRAVAESLGLPPAAPIPPEQHARGYITAIRRNWHLLPYEQLLTLLNMTADQLAYTLREDDFLFIKLGSLKPACTPLRYEAPTEQTTARCADIRKIIKEVFGDELTQPCEPRFGFVQEFSKAVAPASLPAGTDARPTGLRFIYSYFALYGDPLSNPALDPYPDGLLQRLSALGVNGIWMHTVLYTLAPSPTFPEFGAGHENRLASLRKLVERAQKYGISIYLYMNEPRAMPAAFFKDRTAMKGVQEGDHFAMCTSDPQVRQWLSDSLAYVFKNVPGLGGVFTITASENLTSCASHGQEKKCPRCAARSAAEIVAEVNAAIEAGVHRGNPDAKVIAWDWGWGGWAGDCIAKLPKSIWFMSVSEWDKPIERGGVKTNVGEYSISAVGPGPRATRNWALAKAAGLKTVAKVQINNTWELSAVPYLPVLDLTAEHAGALSESGIDGMMLSWSLGGYPSPNLEVVRAFQQKPKPSADAVLDQIAREHFGADGAPLARKAWTAFSNAFREYPYHISVLYNAPQQMGPANLLFATPSGFHATMVGLPYDDLKTWRGPYPPEVFASQFEKVSEGWAKGLPELQSAVEKAPAERASEARAQLNFAQAAQLHFRSVASQARFVIARDAKKTHEMRKALADEIDSARKLFTLTRQDSRIGYEASNHYYYVPLDMVEKVLNCREIMGRLGRE